MNTLEIHGQVNGYIQSIGTALKALEHSFKHLAPRTQLDDACIDALTAQAQQLILQAGALKNVQHVGGGA